MEVRYQLRHSPGLGNCGSLAGADRAPQIPGRLPGSCGQKPEIDAVQSTNGASGAGVPRVDPPAGRHGCTRHQGCFREQRPVAVLQSPQHPLSLHLVEPDE
jgi:hypothetical protein